MARMRGSDDTILDEGPSAGGEGNEDGTSRIPFWTTLAGKLTLGSIPFVAGVLVWYVAAPNLPPGWEFAVPPLGDTLHALQTDLFVTHEAWKGLAATLQEMLVALVISGSAGVTLGIAIGLVSTLETALYPAILAVNSVPKIAIAPLMVLVFGFGMGSRVAVAVAVAVFPIMVNTIAGMKAIRLDEIDLLRSLEASRLQFFLKVRLPRAIPAIFAGLEVGTVFSLLGVVVAEFLSGTDGLGGMITLRSARVAIPEVYSALIVLSLLGIAVSLIVRVFGQLLSRWEEA